jgi:Uma2 family endonuclease
MITSTLAADASAARGYARPMRAILLEVPESLLAERRRLGHDRWDEMWEGVLHMVPAPSDGHQRLGTKVVVHLEPLADARGLVLTYESNFYRGEGDFRVPDVVVSRPDQRSPRGVDRGAELVIEILSPNDESREKLPFYESCGVKEVFIIDPDSRTVELYVLRGGKLLATTKDEQGRLRSEVLGVTFTTTEGPKLTIAWPGGSASV